MTHKTHDPTRPTVPEVAPYVDAIYDSPDGGAGCCLHIALDDGNLEDSHLEYCIEAAQKRGHAVCEKAARLMLRMTGTQRGKVRRGTGGPAHAHDSVAMELLCVNPHDSRPDSEYVMRGDILTYIQRMSDATVPLGEERPL